MATAPPPSRTAVVTSHHLPLPGHNGEAATVASACPCVGSDTADGQAAALPRRRSGYPNTREDSLYRTQVRYPGQQETPTPEAASTGAIREPTATCHAQPPDPHQQPPTQRDPTASTLNLSEPLCTTLHQNRPRSTRPNLQPTPFRPTTTARNYPAQSTRSARSPPKQRKFGRKPRSGNIPSQNAPPARSSSTRANDTSQTARTGPRAHQRRSGGRGG